jgi:endonuclease I
MEKIEFLTPGKLYILMKFRILRTIALILVMAGFVTHGQIPAGYYTSANGLSGSALKAALHNIIDDHTELSYTAVTNALKVTDEDPSNTNNVICIYTGWSYSKSEYGGLYNQWNKEHVWSKSHGDFGDNPPEGTDLHHLRPCDASVNSAKSNRDFSKGTTQYYDSGIPTGCYTAPYIWEPRNEDKGDVARMIFYMAVRYEGDNGETNLELVSYVNTAPAGQPLYGNLDTLLKWHGLDPVDPWEINRNDKIYYQYQANRNPFIDHPEYVDMIWGEEPVAHVSDFSANDITLTWIDPTSGVLPDGYLIRHNITGLNDIVAPTDGLPVDNDQYNRNVAYGTGQYIYKGAIQGNTYYFKIYPYRGSGDFINYKTDGNIQQVTIQIN